MPTVADPNDYETVANPNDYEAVAQPAPIVARSGAQMESLEARDVGRNPEVQAGVEAAIRALPENIKAATTAQTAILNPLSYVSEALTPQPVKEFMRTPLVSPETVQPIRQALQYPAQTLSSVLFGEPFQEPLPQVGRFVSEQIAGQLTPENIALIAGTEGLGSAEKILAKRAPSLTESLFGRKPALPIAAPTEAAAVGPPPVPSEYDRRLLVTPERRFTLQEEPKPEIAPVQPLEQQLAGIQTERGVAPTLPQENPLAPNAFPSISQSGEAARRSALSESDAAEASRQKATSPDRWFREKTNEGQILGQQQELLRRSGQPIPKPLQDAIDRNNAELRQGFVPSVPEVPVLEVPPEQGLRTGVQPETAKIGGEPSATQERQIAESSQPKYQGNGEGRTPTETGGSGSTEPSAQVAGPEAVAPTAETPPSPATTQEGAKPPIQTQPTGISTERLQDTYGKDAVLVTKGRSPEAFQAIGQADKRDPYAVLSKAQQNGIAPPDDVPVLRAEHQRLLNAARDAYGTPQYNELAQRAVDFANATKTVAHGPASDIFRSLQDVDKPRLDSPADFDNIVRERMKRESTPKEQETFKKVTDEVKNGDSEARQAADEAQQRLSKYKPKEEMKFDDAADFVRKQVAQLVKDCVL